MGFGSFLGPIGDIVGGFMSYDQSRKQFNQAMDAQKRQLRTMRADAEAAGFNPLTALMAGAGNNYGGIQGSSPLASISMITGGLSDLGNLVTGPSEAEKKREADQDRLNALKLEQAETSLALTKRQLAGGFSSKAEMYASASKPKISSDVTMRDFLQREKVEKDFANAMAGPKPMVRAYNPMVDSWTELRPDVADSIGVEDGGVLLARHMEEISGDVVADVSGLANALTEMWRGRGAFGKSLRYGDSVNSVHMPDTKPSKMHRSHFSNFKR